MKKSQGFTLVELILTLTVIATISFLSFQSINKDFENKQAMVAGEQIRNIGTGVNNYIVNHYDVLSKLENSSGGTQDPGPRTCDTVKQICEISTQTLVNEGMLPPVFSNKNIYGSGYKVIISRKGSSPYWNISALITTDTALSRSGGIRYDLLGKAMQTAGIDSGMTRTSSTKVDGYKGTWSATQTDYSNIDKQGLLAYIAGYGSNSYSAFLRRDGTLPMTGDLNMGTKDIYGAANITASGKGSFGGEVEAGSWIHARNEYGDLISIGGDSIDSDYEIKLGSSKPLSIYSPTIPAADRQTTTVFKTNGQMEVDGNQLVAGKIGTNGLNPSDIPSGFAGGVRTVDVVANGTVGVIKSGSTGASKNWAAYMTNTGTIYSSADIIADGKISAGRSLNGKNGNGDQFSIGGGDGNDYEFSLGANLPLKIWRSGGTSNETRLKVWGKQENTGDLTVTGDSTNSSGHITASGNIKGKTLESSGRVTVGEFLQINGAASIGAACTPNGLQGHVSSGMPVYCIDGKWQSIGSMVRIVTVSQNSADAVTITCNSNEVAVGGGGKANNGVGFTDVQGKHAAPGIDISMPAGVGTTGVAPTGTVPDRWILSGMHAASANPENLVGFVVCMRKW
ncbi:TPA: shufflon system plasmid conjugative transfer pilus tip adhesin PilV [Citrobacter koseri]|nr:shufflon system plasmid conjugative transfer pilus tip adhesin PilV [Citrobacter koseri]